jgi:hypothetical protein
MLRLRSAAILLLYLVAPSAARAQFDGVFVPQPGARVTEAQFQQLMFGRAVASAAAPRDWAERLLADEIQLVDSQCRLSDEQRRKLQLAGRGDIKLCFDRIEELRQRTTTRDLSAAEWEAALVDLRAASGVFQGGLFVEGSLFRKTLARILTAEQRSIYAAQLRARRLAEVRTVLATWERQAVGGEKLPEAKRKALAELVVEKTPPPRVSGTWAHYVILLQIAEIEREILPVFSESDHAQLVLMLGRARQLEPQMRQMGYWPPSDEDAKE